MIYINWNSIKRPGRVVLLMGTVFMLFGLLFLVVAGNQIRQEQKYQSGQCIITARQLQHEVSTTTSTTVNNYGNGNGNKTYTTTTTRTDVYAPYFEYTVRTADGRSYAARGYDGLDTYTSDHAGQQAIVDRYNRGQSYQCWYNPAKPTQAILVRQPDWLAILLGGGFLLLGGILAIIGLALLGLFRHRERSSQISFTEKN